MNTVAPPITGTITLSAPAAGRVELHAPRALCGELEVFERGEVVAAVGGAPVEAPEHGFLLRALALDGARVDVGEPVVTYRVA